MLVTVETIVNAADMREVHWLICYPTIISPARNQHNSPFPKSYIETVPTVFPFSSLGKDKYREGYGPMILPVLWCSAVQCSAVQCSAV